MLKPVFDYTRKQTNILIGVFVILILLAYYFLHGSHVLYNGDDAWTMTRLYHFSKTGINMDTIFRAVTTDERIQIFNQLFNYLYTGWLHLFGWTKSSAHLLCILIMTLAAAVWYHILKALNFSHSVVVIFTLTLFLFPAYYGTANLIRTDPLTFFFSALSFYLFIKQKYFFAAVVGCMAVETHPMGIITGFYILAYVLSERKLFFGETRQWRKAIGPLILGLILGIGYYLVLHAHVLNPERLKKTLLDNRNNAKELPNYLITYFAQTEWYLHFWEFFLMLGTVIWYLVKKGWRQNSFVGWFLIFMIISTFVTGRPNRVYMVFIFPAFHLMLLSTAEQAGKLKTVTYLLLVIFLLHYGNLYRMNHSYDGEAIRVKTEALIPDKSIPVVGMADNWFAAKDHDFHLIYNSIHDLVDRPFTKFYLIENDYLHIAPVSIRMEEYALEKKLTKDALILKRKKHYQNTITTLKEKYDCQLLGKFPAYRGKAAKVNICFQKVKLRNVK